MDYEVRLDAFQGPMDLLLFLVKQHEVDVRDIPIALITQQFLEYLNIIQLLDVEFAGEFIVMASTLMEIKSKMLLPLAQEQMGGEDREASAGELPADPRRELVRQLIEYRKFKDAAGKLEEKAESRSIRLSRQAPPEPRKSAGAPAVRPVELWDLVSAFARLMRESESLKPTQIIVDDTPQHVYEDTIRSRLRQEGRVSLRSLISPPFRRAQLIGLLLAMLELIKSRELALEQTEPFGEIWLIPPLEQNQASLSDPS